MRKLLILKSAFILAATIPVTGVTQASAEAAKSSAQPVWMKVFNGQDLSGWYYDSTFWRADSGMIRGEGKAPYNTFCSLPKKFSDFELTAKTRLWQTPAGYTNSGIQYRSTWIDSSLHRMKGYQSDIGDNLDAMMYPEGGYPPDANPIPPADACMKSIHQNDWNHILITADGKTVTHTLNGIKCLDFQASVLDGYIALQLNATTLVQKVEFKDFYIRPLNNSFEIPDSLAVTLDSAYAGVRPGAPPRTSKGWFNLADNRLTLEPTGYGIIRVTLADLRGRIEFAESFAMGKEALRIDLPEIGTGNHILQVRAGSKTQAAVIHFGR